MKPRLVLDLVGLASAVVNLPYLARREKKSKGLRESIV